MIYHITNLNNKHEVYEIEKKCKFTISLKTANLHSFLENMIERDFQIHSYFFFDSTKSQKSYTIFEFHYIRETFKYQKDTHKINKKQTENKISKIEDS